MTYQYRHSLITIMLIMLPRWNFDSLRIVISLLRINMFYFLQTEIISLHATFLNIGITTLLFLNNYSKLITYHFLPVRLVFFGDGNLFFAYGTRISAWTSGAGKYHLTPPCKTSRVRWRHDFPCTTFVQNCIYCAEFWS